MLVLLGLGFVATITAAIAAHFVESADAGPDINGELIPLHHRLDTLESLLGRRAEAGNKGDLEEDA